MVVSRCADAQGLDHGLDVARVVVKVDDDGNLPVQITNTTHRVKSIGSLIPVCQVDFEAVTVNFTTYVLAVASVLSSQYCYDITILGMSFALLADSYFALRFKSDSDQINYTPIENFARKSWTAEAFVIERNIFI